MIGSMSAETPIDEHELRTVDASLGRLGAGTSFLDRFYELFLASSPNVREKFAGTNFYKQKRALQSSLYAMLRHMRDKDPESNEYLGEIAGRHSRAGLDIGAELYDLWLDSLLAAVKECDPEWTEDVAAAWERSMTQGIQYFLSRF
jgi:hemoglobin-like flavoprotein